MQCESSAILGLIHKMRALLFLWLHLCSLKGISENEHVIYQGKVLSCSQTSKLKEVFLHQDLDSFLTWLVQTQTSAASDQLPNDLEEAEKLINKHAALKEEIGRWVPERQLLIFLFPEAREKKIHHKRNVFGAGMRRTTSDCRP